MRKDGFSILKYDFLTADIFRNFTLADLKNCESLSLQYEKWSILTQKRGEALLRSESQYLRFKCYTGGL